MSERLSRSFSVLGLVKEVQLRSHSSLEIVKQKSQVQALVA
jgi:hypothetical protein